MLNWDDPIAQFKTTGQPNPAEAIVDEHIDRRMAFPRGIHNVQESAGIV